MRLEPSEELFSEVLLTHPAQSAMESEHIRSDNRTSQDAAFFGQHVVIIK